MRVRQSQHLIFNPYIAATAMCLAALLFAYAIEPMLGFGPTFPFLTSVAIAAWYGGTRVGVYNSVLAALLIYFGLMLPGLATIVTLPWLALFMAFCLLQSWLLGRGYMYEQELHSTKTQLEFIISSISDGITALDRNLQPVFANQAAANMLNFRSPGHIIETPSPQLAQHIDVFDENGKPISLDEMPQRKAILQGVAREMTYFMRMASGEERWIKQKSVPFFDANGAVLLAISVMQDITEQRAYEGRLQAEQKRLQSILDNLPSFVGVMTPDGVLTYANRLALQTISDSNDVMNKRLDETYWWAYDPKMQAQCRHMLDRVRAGEVVRADVELRVGGDDRIVVDFMLSPIYEDGEIVALIPAGVDITWRKAIEKERVNLLLSLADERTRLKNIFENIPGIVMEMWIEDQKITSRFTSDYAEKLLGYPMSQWEDKETMWQEIMHPEDFEHVSKDVLAAYERGEGIIDYRVYDAQGKLHDLEGHMKVIKWADKREVLLTINMDVTERKNATRELSRYAQELKRSNEELQQFAYVASHDLQEPLRMVTSYMQLLQQRYKEQLDPDAQEFISYAVDGATRMKSLIQDLLTYSRVETAAREFSVVEMNDVIKTLQRNLRFTLEETGTSITNDELPKIHADEQQITQLFQNLISNAIKFRSDQTPHIHLGVKREGRFWQFCVQDNGIGIDQQYYQRIFVIFQRLHNRSKYPGTGIGLAICKKVVERHGGTIWVESTPGQGTTFYFTLPAA